MKNKISQWVKYQYLGTDLLHWVPTLEDKKVLKPMTSFILRKWGREQWLTPIIPALWEAEDDYT